MGQKVTSFLRTKSALAIVSLSVRPSVCLSATTRYRFKPKWDRTSRFSPYDTVKFLVFFLAKFCAAEWGDSPPMKTLERGSPLRNRYFTAINLSSMRTVADRHWLAVYTNALLPTSITLNDVASKIEGFSKFFAILGCDTHFNSKLRRNHRR